MSLAALFSVVVLFQNCGGTQFESHDLTSGDSEDLFDFASEIEPEPPMPYGDMFAASVRFTQNANYVQNHLDKITTDANGYAAKVKNSNEKVAQFWGMGLNYRAAYELYQHSRDPAVLNFFLDQAALLRTLTSAKLNRTGWPATEVFATGYYTCGVAYADFVHNMVVIDNVIFGLAEAALRNAKKGGGVHNAAMDREIRSHATFFQGIFNHFAAQRKTSGNRTYYVFPSDAKIKSISPCAAVKDVRAKFDGAIHAGKPAPLNMTVSAGQAHYQMYRLYSALGLTAAANSHKLFFGNIARYTKTILKKNKVNKKDLYFWDYMEGGRPEDTAHAFMTVRFMTTLFEAGWIFTKADLTLMANTFYFLYLEGGKKVRTHLSASYPAKDGITNKDAYRAALARFIPICQADTCVGSRVRGGLISAASPLDVIIQGNRYKDVCNQRCQ